MNTPNLDAGIPVLTEIIAPVAENEVIDSPVVTLPKTVTPAPKEAPAASSMPSAPGMTVEQLNQLENQVAQRVLQQILGQIELALEQRVRDSLADVLQTAVEGLAVEIRQGLEQTVKDVIARAVAQEIEQLQKIKN